MILNVKSLSGNPLYQEGCLAAHQIFPENDELCKSGEKSVRKEGNNPGHVGCNISPPASGTYQCQGKLRKTNAYLSITVLEQCHFQLRATRDGVKTWRHSEHHVSLSAGLCVSLSDSPHGGASQFSPAVTEDPFIRGPHATLRGAAPPRSFSLAWNKVQIYPWAK